VLFSSRRLIPLVAFGALHCGSSGSHAAPSLDGGAADSAPAPPPSEGGAEASASYGAGAEAGRETGASDGSIATPEGGAARAATIGTFVGVNALITDSVANIAPIGVVREYHNWGWLGNNYNDQPYPQTLYTPDIPSFGWDWDSFFSGLQTMGVSGFPAVQGAAPWVNGSAVPPASGSPTAAASYIAHGDTMFQIAARWGKTKVADSMLKLESGQTRKSGLATVEYFEDYNEQDNAAGFTGDVFAAMASADCDGDEGRLGGTIGVKKADPSAKLVMGGLSGKYGAGNTWVSSITTFLDAARTWSAAHRTDATFATDVVNVHYYSFGPGAPAPALSPEADGVEAKLAAIVSYRDQHMPGKPVWWTEFGYDTFGGSPLHAPALGSNSAFVVQGQWLVRDLLAALAAGVERATVFELDDTCTPPASACNTQFATAGLLAMGGSRKPAWYYLATFRARLASYTYVGTVPTTKANVNVAQFADTGGSGGALVVWMGTSNASVTPGYALSLPSGTSSAKAVALTDGQATGVETTLTPSAGAVTLDVSETPTIVLYSP
jgi:hypothetical protein